MCASCSFARRSQNLKRKWTDYLMTTTAHVLELSEMNSHSMACSFDIDLLTPSYSKHARSWARSISKPFSFYRWFPANAAKPNYFDGFTRSRVVNERSSDSLSKRFSLITKRIPLAAFCSLAFVMEMSARDFTSSSSSSQSPITKARFCGIRACCVGKKKFPIDQEAYH